MSAAVSAAIAVPTTVLLVVTAAVAVVTVAVAAVAGISGRPQAWIVRAGAFAIGTMLLAIALLGGPMVHDLAALAFNGQESDAGTPGAEVAVRLTLAALATAVLVVPGTWLDVGVGVVAVLSLAAINADYREREKLLRCDSAHDAIMFLTGAKPSNCPQDESPPPPAAVEGAVRVLLPKARTVPPANALPAGTRVAVVAVVEERDADGRIATVAHPYSVILVSEVAPTKPTADVAVDIQTAGAARYQRFLADVTTAKKLWLMAR